MRHTSSDVLIVGGGLIGCSIAYYASRAGLRVMLLERGNIAGEASLVGAGMLAPFAETHAYPADLPSTHPLHAFRALCLTALRCYKELDHQLKRETGLDIGLARYPLLRPAFSDDEAHTLQDELAHQRHHQADYEWLDSSTVARHEPVLAAHPTLVGALLSPHEYNVSAPLLTQAYAHGAALHGASSRTGCTVTRLLLQSGRVVGVDTEQGPYYAERVVLATGAWAARWHTPQDTPPVYPLKGQLLALRPPATSAPCHTIYDGTTGTYLVPKTDGHVYIGATSETVGFDKTVTPAGIASLCTGLARLAPRLMDAPFVWARAGLRPASADGLPLIGETQSQPGLWLASGHYRNGILLGPLTGILLAEMLQGHPIPFDLNIHAFDPDRFGGWDQRHNSIDTRSSGKVV